MTDVILQFPTSRRASSRESYVLLVLLPFRADGTRQGFGVDLHAITNNTNTCR